MAKTKFREADLVGKVLLAEPFLFEPTFKRAVISIVDHHPLDGTIGFILNKPIKMQIADLVPDFPDFEAYVSYGGPVATDTIHFLHNIGELVDDSRRVMRGLYWGGDFSKLKFLIQQELVQPENVRFFVGYSGWEAGQLKGEMEDDTWLISDMDPNYAFKNANNIKLWRQVLQHMGDVHSVIGQMPEGNTLN